jgi:hypothetical protein
METRFSPGKHGDYKIGSGVCQQQQREPVSRHLRGRGSTGVGHETEHCGGPDKYILLICQYIQDKTAPFLTPFPKTSLKRANETCVAVFAEAACGRICGLDKYNVKFGAIRANIRSVTV